MRGRAPAQCLAHSKRPVTVPECFVCSFPAPSAPAPKAPRPARHLGAGVRGSLGGSGRWRWGLCPHYLHDQEPVFISGPRFLLL